MNDFQKIQVVRVKAMHPSVFIEDLPASADATDTADDELTSGLVDAVTIDIRTLILGLTLGFG